MENDTKQVIVVRKFKNLRTGKYCSQVAHASMAFLTSDCLIMDYSGSFNIDELDHAKEIKHWLENSFKKIVVYVETEQELLDLFDLAKNKGLDAHLIQDEGLTEFNNIPTYTCLAIGPHWSNKFEGVTDNLKLL